MLAFVESERVMSSELGTWAGLTGGGGAVEGGDQRGVMWPD